MMSEEKLPEQLFESLMTNVLMYARLKKAFDSKLNKIPFQLRKKYNLDEMQKLLKEPHLYKEIFLERAYLLGFSSNIKPYVDFYTKPISIYAQAQDYIKFLFLFDESMHKMITNILAINRNRKNKKHTDIKKLYNYLEYISQ